MNKTGRLPEALPRRSPWGFLLLLYPVLLFFLLASGKPMLEFAGVASLAALILLPALMSRRWFALPVLLLVAGLAAYGAFGGHTALVMFLPQILIGSLLAFLFGRTLRPGSVPLITRIATAIHGDDGSSVPQRYTRGVTILWFVLFLLLVLEGIVLILLAPSWSAARVNVITYGVIALVVVGEYLVHNVRYPHPAHRGLPDFLRHLVRIDYRRLLDD